MRRGKNYTLFDRLTVQRAGVQKYPAGSTKQKNGPEVHRHGYGENAKNAINSGVVALIVFRYDDNRRRDLDGAVATIFDALVRAGVLQDDDTQHISAVCATSVKVPKGQAGVEITLGAA